MKTFYSNNYYSIWFLINRNDWWVVHPLAIRGLYKQEWLPMKKAYWSFIDNITLYNYIFQKWSQIWHILIHQQIARCMETVKRRIKRRDDVTVAVDVVDILLVIVLPFPPCVTGTVRKIKNSRMYGSQCGDVDGERRFGGTVRPMVVVLAKKKAEYC